MEDDGSLSSSESAGCVLLKSDVEVVICKCRRVHKEHSNFPSSRACGFGGLTDCKEFLNHLKRQLWKINHIPIVPVGLALLSSSGTVV